MKNNFDREYTNNNGRKVRVRYLNEKSYSDFLYECAEDTLIQKAMNQIEQSKKL